MSGWMILIGMVIVSMSVASIITAIQGSKEYKKKTQKGKRKTQEVHNKAEEKLVSRDEAMNVDALSAEQDAPDESTEEVLEVDETNEEVDKQNIYEAECVVEAEEIHAKSEESWMQNILKEELDVDMGLENIVIEGLSEVDIAISNVCEEKKDTPPTITFYKIQASKQDANITFDLSSPLKIGRNKEVNQWVLEDETVSDKHCHIYYYKGEFFLQDLLSTNGTYHNDKRLKSVIKLENHDKLRIGKSEYRIKC